MYKLYEKYLAGDDIGKLLRATIFFCLLGNTDHLTIEDSNQFLRIFDAFHKCQDLLFENDQLPKSISGEIQLQICVALKKLVKDFTRLRYSAWRDVAEKGGDWIYVVPFIHLWDVSEEKFEKWFPMNGWKHNIRFVT